MPERPRAHLAVLRLVVDITITELALFSAVILRPMLPFGIPLTEQHTRLRPFVYVFVALVWGVAFLLLSVYEMREQRATDEAQAVFVAVSLATVLLAGMLYFSYRQISRLQILTFYALDLILLLCVRLVMRTVRKLRSQAHGTARKVLVLGAGAAGQDAIQMVEGHRWAGLEPVGFLDDGHPPGTQMGGYPVLGKLEQVGHFVDSMGIHEVVVALPVQAYDQFFRLIGGFQHLQARVRFVPDHIKRALFRTQVEEFAGVPMITLQEPTLTPFERKVKRAFDLVVGIATLILILPLLGLIAIVVRFDSPGPIIFKQQRVGENGKLFWMYKFRSMIQDAEKKKADSVQILDNGELVHKLPEDPRVTRVGKFIRRTSMDELPNIFNVLKGEMSIVGPRPELPWLVEEHYQPWQWQRFSVPQGITGWWQVNGRSDKPMHLHTEEDLFYIQHYSLLLDIKILWRTVGAVIRSQGAY